MTAREKALEIELTALTDAIEWWDSAERVVSNIREVERRYRQMVDRVAPARAALAMPEEEPEITEEEIAELERAEREDAWAAPWTAHTFEIECPCPNGEDCGDLHTCDEVEAREAYPASREEPADEGDGQCVVQITVPGLESLAGPNARFIASSRNALPRLLADLRRLRGTL